MTAMHLIMRSEKLTKFHGYKILELMMKNKADPNIKNSNLETPLEVLNNRNIGFQYEIVKLFVQNKVDFSVEEKKSTLHFYLENGNDLEIVRYLINNKSNLNRMGKKNLNFFFFFFFLIF